MNNSNDSHDLQLEDVEDFASSGYPNGDYPPTEESVTVGSVDGSMKATRMSRVTYLVRKHKWATGLAFIILVISIVILSTVGGSKPVKNVNTSAQSDMIGHVDPKSLDPEITDALMKQLTAAYTRKALSSSPLESTTDVTPQKKAFYWLAANTGVLEMDHTELMQRYAMAVFYYSTNAVKTPYTKHPKPWVSATAWLSLSHVCEWKGISCSDDNHIEEIKLPENNLSGSLPMELWFISATLHTLDLTSNLIYMNRSMFDVFTQMTQIHTLMLDDNFLVLPHALPSQMKSMERLRKIVLSHNVLSGRLERLHQVLPSWSQLTHLEIEGTYLAGTLPTYLGQMTNLAYLYLRNNELNGNLDFLKSGNLTGLFEVWLDDNHNMGTIPTEIGLLTELASISISNATLSGKIPTEIGNLVALRRLWLYGNTLTGAIPTQLGNCPKLEVLELHENGLIGKMPQGVCSIVNNADFEQKSLTSDCQAKVTCNDTCCTRCY